LKNFAGRSLKSLSLGRASRSDALAVERSAMGGGGRNRRPVRNNGLDPLAIDKDAIAQDLHQYVAELSMPDVPQHPIGRERKTRLVSVVGAHVNFGCCSGHGKILYETTVYAGEVRVPAEGFASR